MDCFENMVDKKPISKAKNKKAPPVTSSAISSDIINFRSSIKLFCEFSNFYQASFTIDGKEWKTVEHYFQAQKCLNEKVREELRALSTPKEAKKMGSKVLLRSDWDKVKINIMVQACRAKFTQNEALKKLLLSTGIKELREHTARDKFWGDGGNGKGRNELGKVLMKIREELQLKENLEKKIDENKI